MSRSTSGLRWRAARRADLLVAGAWGTGALALVALRGWAPAVVAWAVTLAGVMPPPVRLAPECVFHAVAGLPCPTCGATRAVLRLAAGDAAGALAWNPLVALAALGFVGGGLAAPLWLALARRVPVLPAVWPPVWRAAAAAAFVLHWSFLIARGV